MEHPVKLAVADHVNNDCLR